MRKTLSMLLLATTLPAAAIAAPQMKEDMMMAPCHGHAEMGSRPGMMGMMGDLKLTPEQRKVVHQAKSTAMEERREITKRYLDKLSDADKAAMQKELKASADKADKAFQDQLTPEQRKSFAEFRKQREERRSEWEEFQKWKAEKASKGQ